ncbi:hypothetical protein Glove_286g13 [Diversispora epigaea]|uniref:Integrase catalytic domain-containing protein n=1 Tax=Diversispora epigaea TaxID=1348612 RepID=A0A397I0V9_9GLOM|nr:hypothetical protein Glove_286g13 [Diversispora epigaea]
MPYDKVGNITYMFCLTCVDIASRYKWAELIGTYLDILNRNEDEFSLEGILTSTVVTETFERMLFNDPECFITWDMIKLVMTDKGSEFKGDFEKLLKKHNVKNQKANSKSTMGIVENFNGIFAKKLFRIQDAYELLLPLSERSKVWVKNRSIVFRTLNNTITRLIGMTPNKARKKKHVYAKSSKPRNGSMWFDEERLPYGVSVRYLLKPGELEGGKRRGTDCNWSPQTYSIKESLI